LDRCAREAADAGAPQLKASRAKAAQAKRRQPRLVNDETRTLNIAPPSQQVSHKESHNTTGETFIKCDFFIMTARCKVCANSASAR
jgi:hypothetical protein